MGKSSPANRRTAARTANQAHLSPLRKLFKEIAIEKTAMIMIPMANSLETYERSFNAAEGYVEGGVLPGLPETNTTSPMAKCSNPDRKMKNQPNLE